MSDTHEPPPHPGRDAIQALLAQGRQEFAQFDYMAAAASFASAAHEAQMLGDLESELDAINLQANAARASGQPQRALGILSRVLRRASGPHVQDQIARMRSNMGQLNRELGNFPEALSDLMTAQEFFDLQAKPARPSAINLINMGLLYQDMGRYREAAGYLARAQRIGTEIEDDALVAVALNNLANGDLATGDLIVARERFKVALEQARELGMPEYVADNLDGLGETLAQLGDYVQALKVHEQALEVAQNHDDRVGEMDALVNLGRDRLQLDDPRRAIEDLTEALDLAADLENRRRELDIHGLLADAYEVTGDPWSALRHARECMELQSRVFDEENQERLRELQVKHQLGQSRNEAETYRLRSELMKQAIDEAENRVRKQTQQLKEAHLDVVERLALAAELHDGDTASHTRRVGRNAALIAWVLGFGREEVEEIFVAAKLHDVGKIGVSDMVLYKPGRLEAEEWALMKQHPSIGARILSGSRSRLLQLAEQISFSHHERFDGSGYPQGLAGKDIPLVARIVAVADVLDALVHSRPYKPAWPVHEALAEVQSEAGRLFDPDVAAACLDIFGGPCGISPLDNVTDWRDIEPLLEQLVPLRQVGAED